MASDWCEGTGGVMSAESLSLSRRSLPFENSFVQRRSVFDDFFRFPPLDVRLQRIRAVLFPSCRDEGRWHGAPLAEPSRRGTCHHVFIVELSSASR